MALLGASDLRRRLKALRNVPKQIQLGWAQRATPLIQSKVKVRTGKTRASLRPTRAGVYGNLTVKFLDRGTKAHEEPLSRFTATGRVRRGKRAAAITGKTLKFSVGGQTLFRKKIKHPQTRGQNFVRPAGKRALDESGLAEVVKAWNDAA